jgi:hypothetical protein
MSEQDSTNEKTKPDEDGEIPSAPLSAEAVRELSEFADDIQIDRFIDIDENADDDDDADAILGEVVETRPPIGKGTAAIDEPSSVTGDPDLDALIASIPKETDVTIVLKRKPDRGHKFRLPCGSGFPHIDKLYWDKRPLEDVYSDIQRIHGGGRYHFQLQYDGGLKPVSWTYTISDPPFASDAEKMANPGKANDREAERIPDASPQFAQQPPATSSPFDEMMTRLEEAQKFKTLLAPEQPLVPSQPVIEVRDQIALEMMKSTAGDPELGGAVIRKMLGIPTEKKGDKDWADVAWAAVSNLDQVAGVVATIVPLIGKFFGGAAPANAALPPGAIIHRPNTPSGIVLPKKKPDAIPPPGESQAAPAVAIPPQTANQAVTW